MIIVLLLGVLTVSALWELYYRHRWAQDVSVRLWFETDAV